MCDPQSMCDLDCFPVGKDKIKPTVWRNSMDHGKNTIPRAEVTLSQVPALHLTLKDAEKAVHFLISLHTRYSNHFLSSVRHPLRTELFLPFFFLIGKKENVCFVLLCFEQVTYIIPGINKCFRSQLWLTTRLHLSHSLVK